MENSWKYVKDSLSNTTSQTWKKVGIGAAVALVSYPILTFAAYRANEALNTYNHYSTAKQICGDFKSKLAGKVVVITGCNTGIGKETVKRLFEAGAIVVMACRNLEKAGQARADILQETDSKEEQDLVVLQLDLGDLSTVGPFVEALLKHPRVNKRIDYLVLNAGVMGFPEFGTTTNGFESQFGINHIGHFLLTNLLLPVLKENKTRIVALSSVGHTFSSATKMRAFLDAPGFKGPTPDNLAYTPWVYYGVSKMCNILFVRHLNKLYGKDGIVALACHPGGIRTELGRHTKFDFTIALFTIPYIPYFKTVEQGASTTVRAMTIDKAELFAKSADQSVENMNVYFANSRPREGKLQRDIRYWSNSDIDEKLWQYSVRALKEAGFDLDKLIK